MSQNKIINSIPNTITSLNVLSGCLSVVFAFSGNLVYAGIFILCAAVFDFFDGMSARLLNAYSDMGKELDSLADVISFGFAPAVIVFIMVKQQIAPNTEIINLPFSTILIIILPFVMTIFSALRLAKFNIDDAQTTSFIGLPTPANAIIWASIPIITSLNEQSVFNNITTNPYLSLALCLILSFLLVSNIPMFSLKFKTLKISDNKIQFSFIAICITLLIMFRLSAIPIIILTYIMLSVILWIFKPKQIGKNE